MNPILEKFARDYLKINIVFLPDGQQNVFKLMYGTKNGKINVDEAKKRPILEVVQEMEKDKLDWAMTQVESSLKKIKKL
jgi:hypothetical protein